MIGSEDTTSVPSTRVTDASTRSFVSPRDQVHWYPVYVSYRRELTVKQALDDRHVENFLPMQERFERQGRKIVKLQEPAVHNLIFVYASQNTITDLKMFCRDCAPMQYMTVRARTADQASTVITVSRQKMEQFMAAMRIDDDQNRRTLLPYDETLYGHEGRAIRFVRGPFAGIEGTIKRIRKNRSLIITLQHVGVLCITIDRASDIEFLDE